MTPCPRCGSNSYDHSRWARGHRIGCSDCPQGPQNTPEMCGHNGPFTFEWAGWENHTEPLQIEMTCQECWGTLLVKVEDAHLLPWERLYE